METYLQNGIDREPSTYTLSTQRAALCKLYGCKASDFAIQLPERRRGDIQRIWNENVRDYGFSKDNSTDILDFARATGLRGRELAAEKPKQICQNTDGSYLKYPDGRRVKEWQLVSSYYRCKNGRKGDGL